MSIDSFYIELHRAKEIVRLLKEIKDFRSSCEKTLMQQTERCTELYNRIDQILEYLTAASLKNKEEG
jgi:hypothetical protein